MNQPFVKIRRPMTSRFDEMQNCHANREPEQSWRS